MHFDYLTQGYLPCICLRNKTKVTCFILLLRSGLYSGIVVQRLTSPAELVTSKRVARLVQPLKLDEDRFHNKSPVDVVSFRGLNCVRQFTRLTIFSMHSMQELYIARINTIII